MEQNQVQTEAINVQLPPIAEEVINEQRLKAHVYMLISQTGARLTEKRIDKLIKLGDLNKINETFFTNLDTWVKERPELTDEQKKLSIFKISAIISQSSTLQDLRSSRDAYQADAKNYTENASRCLSEGQKQHLKILEIENRGDIDLAPQVEAINKLGFYEFQLEASEKEDLLVFYTNPIVLSYKHEKAGINIEGLSFGRMKVKANLVNGRITVHKLAKNIEVGGYFHPHINTTGSVCWGNAAKLVVDSLQNFDLVPIMTAVQVILTSYNEASPYKSIEMFDMIVNPQKYPFTYMKQVGTHTLYPSDWLHNDNTTRFRLDQVHPEDIRQFETKDYTVVNSTNKDSLSEIVKLYKRRDIQSFFNKDANYVRLNWYKQQRGGVTTNNDVYLRDLEGNYKSRSHFIEERR